MPLLIVPPARSRSPGVVSETVSLRDLPATIVDLVGLEAGSPFPGPSLARPVAGFRSRRPDSVVDEGVDLRADGPESDQSESGSVARVSGAR